ncbi:THO complex subunit 2 [Tetranychus urticae]|uniref:THO complex subunit 2 n=1 Tax=Tetranychus urticae TaxID=32264 RepID=UPI00077B8E3E|nr:THO complex subunit 2 [Tetranychus urticae]
MFTDKNWETSGKNDFIKAVRSHTDNPNELKKLLYICCNQAISGQLRHDWLISSLSNIVETNPSIPILLTDVLLVCDIETLAADNKDQRENYLALLAGCSNKLIADVLLKERLDYDTIGEAKIIANKKATSTKFIKLKTRLFYKQQKFNLFREESEGYAKLITELSQPGGFDCNHMLQVLRSLIGCFNLDPNRVLDVVLECFECRPYLADSYISLLCNFLNNSSTLAQILAFKFSFYLNDNSMVTPDSLYEVTALLLQQKLLSLHQIYPFLSPSDKTIFEYNQNEIKDARAYARKTFVSTEEKPMEEDRLSDMEKFSLLINNQKLGLCLALLKVGDWKTAHELIERLPSFYAVTNPIIAKQLCSLIHYAMDIIYHSHSGLPSNIINKVKMYKCDGKPSIKQAETVEELKENVFPMISTLGPFLHSDTLLISKIIRIGKSIMSTTPVGDVKYELLSILDEAILPSLSLIEGNCGLADELWQFLCLFPYTARYRLYFNWKAEPSIPIMIRTRSVNMRRIKYIMKRLSKENVKYSGRQIGKLSHSNPSFLFEYMSIQIQSYDNLIGPVVDSLKYLTSLSYDVLIYCIIEALSNSNKDRTLHDGATISPWLLSLANFCGSVVKKYPVELPGLLQFIANQLKAEKSLDLLILKEIIQKMAGIEASEEMTNEQLAAMSGGELLRAEGGYFNQVRNTRKSSVRLKDTLLESNLAMPLCILMAQQRNCILYSKQEHSHIKLVGKLYDQCQETLVQYGSFLSCNLSIDDYIGRLPSLGALITNFNLSADVAFFLVRPMIAHNVRQKFEELRKNERSSKGIHLYIEAWETVTKPFVDIIIPAFPTKFWEDLSPRFFVTFWTLSIYDLEVPKSSYDHEVEKLKKQIQSTEDNKDMNPGKKKKEIERCRLLQEKLLEEQLRQDEHVRRVRQRLEKERDQWFQSKLAKMEMTTQFLQHCLFPRSIFTATDALYCAKFVHLLHTIKTPNFSTLICYDRIFGDISYTMSSCTENEANHYGRFLCALQETVMRWHKDKLVFEKECAKYPGFVTKFFEKEPAHVDYESYRHVCHKWHYRLTKSFIVCLDSGDYVQIRNALIVLTKLITHFPAINSFAQAIERRIDNIRNTEQTKRPDLYALATGYSGQLKTKRATCVPEHEFHLKPQQPVNSAKTPNNVKKESKQESNNTSAPVTKSPPPKEKKDNILKPRPPAEANENSSEKKKESKNETVRSAEKKEKAVKADRNHISSEKSVKSDSKSSVPSSPRKGDHRGRSVEPPIEGQEREHKRRKIEAKTHEDGNVTSGGGAGPGTGVSTGGGSGTNSERRSEKEKERNENYERRRGGEDSTSSSPSTNNRNHEKKTANSSSRKRDLGDETPIDTNLKKKKDEESSKSKKTSNSDERDSSRKSSETKRSSSSRKNKSEDK